MDIDFTLIKKLSGKERPGKILIFDTETKVQSRGKYEKQVFRMGWFFKGQYDSTNGLSKGKYIYFTKKEKALLFIEENAVDKRKLYVMAHNIFFDLQAMGAFRYFSTQGWQVSFLYDKGLTYILTIKKGLKVICFVSTTNFFDASLKSLGETVGLPKLEVDFIKDSTDTIKDYCKRDVEILVIAVSKYLQFIDVHKMGRFALTKSSQAFNAFRANFLKNPIFHHEEEKIIELERAAYMGGRTEAFVIGQLPKRKYISLDVNSMYPFVMKNYEYPIKITDMQYNIPVKKLATICEQYAVIANVSLNTEYNFSAMRYKNKIVFPIGSFDNVLCTESLRFAIINDLIKDVREVLIYKKEDIFTGFVDYFYDLKAQYKRDKNAVYLKLTKLILNSLYGKFGQLNTIEERLYTRTGNDYYRKELHIIPENKTITVTKLLNTEIVETGEEVGKYSAIAIPAHITDNARMYLYSLMTKIGMDKVLYCDTDSIKCEERYIEPLEPYIDNNELGKLSIENRFDRFAIYGCKDYVEGNKVKIKGIPKSAKKLREGVYEYDQFLRQPSHLRAQEIDAYMLKRTIKTCRRKYDKGIVTESGRVIPYSF